MKTIRYTCDRLYFAKGQVREEDDDTADLLIHRGFAEEVTAEADEEPSGDAEATGEADAPDGNSATKPNSRKAKPAADTETPDTLKEASEEASDGAGGSTDEGGTAGNGEGEQK